MNINEMTPEEKSVMLARLCGWGVRQNKPVDYYQTSLVDSSGNVIINSVFMYHEISLSKIVPNLYAPKNMALAWRVLNWAFETFEFTQDANFSLSEIAGEHSVFRSPPELAQRRWLDKILSLAVEAGMVEERP